MLFYDEDSSAFSFGCLPSCTTHVKKNKLLNYKSNTHRGSFPRLALVRRALIPALLERPARIASLLDRLLLPVLCVGVLWGLGLLGCRCGFLGCGCGFLGV